jgi:Na+/H+-dicarboxylate symporter
MPDSPPPDPTRSDPPLRDPTPPDPTRPDSPPPDADAGEPAEKGGAISLSVQVLLGLAAGLVLGIFLAPAEAGVAARVVAWIEPVGALWVNAIRMTVVPLLVCLLVAGIAGAGTGTAARVGGRSLAWFVGLIGLSAGVAWVCAPPLLRWLGAESAQVAEVATSAAVTEVTLPPFRDWFTGLLPSNPVAAAANGDMLPLVLFSVLFGLAASRIEPHARGKVVAGTRAIADAMFVIIGWILAAAPYGVFALAVGLAARTGSALVGAVAGFVITAALLITLATVLLYPLVAAFSRTPLRLFAKGAAPAQAVGFSTRSSLATLPVLMEEAEKTLRLRTEVVGLSLPAAVSVFKFSSPVARIAGTFFVASLFGVELGLAESGALAIGLGVLSFYSPGIPSGGLFVMAPLYQAFGLPLEGIGVLIALDIVPDMFITASNVTADLAVAALVDPGDSGRRT